jgi:hypothetical protein
MANNLFAFSWMYIIQAEEMINKTALKLYGGVVNSIIIITGAILIAVACVYALNKEFQDEIRRMAAPKKSE